VALIETPGAPLAYEDPDFLGSEDARPLRIIAEYLGPLRGFRRAKVHDTIVFFGSARIVDSGPMSRYYDEARELARLITVWSKNLSSHVHRYVVCSGGGRGIMEAANRGASEAGGRTVGLNISLPRSTSSRKSSPWPRLESSIDPFPSSCMGLPSGRRSSTSRRSFAMA
jgi:hypothetical protein